MPRTWVDASLVSVTTGFPCDGMLWHLVREGCDGSGFHAPAGPIRGFSAVGWGGNYAVVLPASHLIAVRLRDPPTSAAPEEVARISFDAIPRELVGLTR